MSFMLSMFTSLLFGLLLAFGFTDVTVGLYFEALVASFVASWPLLAAVVGMCALVGQVSSSQRGLAWGIIATTYVAALYFAVAAFVGVTGWAFFLLAVAGNATGAMVTFWVLLPRALHLVR